MSTTCQNVIDRATAFNPLNASIAGNQVELLTRIQQHQQRIFTAVAKMRRPRFTTLATVTSSSAGSGRTVDLSTLASPLERLLRVTLAATGAEVWQVSEFDVNAQLAPRHFVRDQILTEVANDWSATTGTVSLNLLYAYGAAAINVNSGTTQNVSVPDPWVDVLIYPLAGYFHLKDPGRDPQEWDRIQGLYSEAWYAFVTYLANLSGDLSRTEDLPAPPEIAKRAA